MRQFGVREAVVPPCWECEDFLGRGRLVKFRELTNGEGEVCLLSLGCRVTDRFGQRIPDRIGSINLNRLGGCRSLRARTRGFVLLF